MYDLGLTEDQFWRLTPCKFKALTRRRRECLRREDFHTGLIASLLYNPYRGTQPAKKASDFFPSLKENSAGEGPGKARKVMSSSEMLALMMSLATDPKAKGQNGEG